MESWIPLFEGSIDDRPVKLLKYHSGELKVETNQLKTELTNGSFEQGSTVFPIVISAGDLITIEADTADQLIQELIVCGFSESGAKEIAQLARDPAA